MRKAHNKPLPRVAEDFPAAAPDPLAPDPLTASFMPAPAPSLPAVIASAPDTPPDIAPSHLVDANGFDPAQYKWIPVLRRQRADGWTVERQQDFIAALADHGLVEHAARVAGMSVTSCYRLRRAPGAENFAAAWDAALGQAAHRLVDLAFDRAINGSDEPVYDNEGNRVGRRRRYDHRMMAFLMRAYLPDRFRHAHQAVVSPGEAPPPALPPIDEALRLLAPVSPERPALTLSPDELADEVEIADAANGRLPHWYRGGEGLDDGIDRRDLDPAPPGAPLSGQREDDENSSVSPALDEAFERILEEAKRAADGRRGRGPDDAQNSD